MPAAEPQLQIANSNFTPELGRLLQDFLARVPFWLTLPIAFGTADAAVLYTVPTGKRLYIHRAHWELATSFTGGASSAIGLSSDDANANTKGDILGGASGDVAATLVSTGVPIKRGTLGAKFGSTTDNTDCVVLAAGKVIRFDRITSAFTAGSGFAHILASFLPTS